MEHSNAIEKVGTGLVCSLETFKGARIEIVKRLSGFNGLSTYKYGQVRKIEIKTFQKSDKWIAINGMRAIDKLFFEQDYWIYFVLLPENVVIATKGLAFIEHQCKLNRDLKYLQKMKKLMVDTKNLAQETRFQLILKINVPFPVPMRKLTDNILKGEIDDWDDAIIEIWENKGEWKRLFLSEKYIEI